MYQALYRKYRPKTFDEVIGQDVIIKILKNAIKNEKLTHAYLFTGPRGTGKTSIAKIMAKTINCGDKIEATPCDNCVVCTQINNNQSTDIIEIDAASNNGVDEIRELKSKVNLVPANSKYKIYIVDEVHMLTVGAFNALLKTLEEPPRHIIFILATTEPHKIPSTILSRCQRFDFKKISVNHIKERLLKIVKDEKIEIDEAAIWEISRLADGGLRDAIGILDQVVSYADSKIVVNDIHEVNGTLPQEELTSFISSIIDGKIDKSFEIITYFDDNGKNIVKLTEEIIIFLRNILLTKIIDKGKEKDEIYLKLAKKISIEELYQLIEEFNDAINKMKTYNNSKIVIELAIIKIISNNKTKIHVEEIENKKTEEVREKQSKKEKSKAEEPKHLSNNISREISKIKEIRINNAFTAISKQRLMDVKNKLSDIQSLILEPNYSETASIIIDGKIKAVGANYLVFVYETERLANNFNLNIAAIEKMLNKVYNLNYKVIATFIEDWEVLRNEYKSRKKKYEYIEEDFDVNNLLAKETEQKDDIQQLFDQIVEYK